MKKISLIYPCSFEFLNKDKQQEQEKGIDDVIKKGHMPVYIFNDDANNKENLIPVEFKENIEKHPGYRLWIDTLLRCYDSGHPDYRNNSFKMTIPLIWVKSFTQFCKDLEITSDMI